MGGGGGRPSIAGIVNCVLELFLGLRLRFVCSPLPAWVDAWFHECCRYCQLPVLRDTGVKIRSRSRGTARPLTLAWPSPPPPVLHVCP